ncbi:MAG: PepSY-associated TM helix domain-containing protein [Acidimicrobiia bacterium]
MSDLTTTMPPTRPPDAPQPERTRTLPARTTKRSGKNEAHHWTRWLHTYTSMIALVLVLFFGITGITLNHPTFGNKATQTIENGTLPAGFLTSDRHVDFLAVTKFVRSTHHIDAPIEDFNLTGTQGTIAFKSPGYAADLLFDANTGVYKLTVEEQSFVAKMNDLHKGRYADSSWKWLIDVIGVVLVVIAGTGLGLQLFLRKRRTRALLIAGGGLLITIVMMVIALR